MKLAGHKKELEKVYAAIVEQGCNTTADISAVVGLSVNRCSHFVAELVRNGEVRHTGRKARCCPHGRLAFNVFEPVNRKRKNVKQGEVRA